MKREFTRFALIHDSFLHDCEPAIVESMRALAAELNAIGLRNTTINVGWWERSLKIYAPIQAWEAARIHAGHFDQFPRVIRERLESGAKIRDAELALLREFHAEFRARLDALLREHELILMPACPISRLNTGEDNTQARGRILRYTTPFSLGGNPVVTIPCRVSGMQLAAAREEDERLLELAASLGELRSGKQRAD